MNEPGDDRLRLATHRRIVENFRNFGLLRLLGPDDANDLLGYIHGAERQIGILWCHLIKDLGQINRVKLDQASPLPSPMREYLESGTLPERLAQLADVVIASENLAPQAEWPARPELAPASGFDLSETMTMFRDLRNDETEIQGTSREDIWERRLRGVTRLSSEVWICDPYLFGKNSFDISVAPKRLRHLRWLLTELAEGLESTGNQAPAIHLLTARREYDPLVATTFLAQLSALQNWTGSLDVTFYTPTPDFKGPHDRHIRFSCGVAFNVPAGFDRLRSGTVKDDEGYKWHFIGPGNSLERLISIEQAIQQHGATTTVIAPNVDED